MTPDALKKGQLLVAEPTIFGDVSFNRSVILLADYSNEGAIGFIINKPLNYTINDLVPDIEANFIIYNGGPVEQDSLYFIHDVPKLITNSVEISSGIFWGGDFNLTRKLINEGKISKNNIRFFLGYTGWDSNQLETEMRESSWIVSENYYKNKIIGKSTADLWKEKIVALGGDYMIWSNAPKNPESN